MTLADAFDLSTDEPGAFVVVRDLAGALDPLPVDRDTPDTGQPEDRDDAAPE
jgi:hypothetical protein